MIAIIITGNANVNLILKTKIGINYAVMNAFQHMTTTHNSIWNQFSSDVHL